MFLHGDGIRWGPWFTTGDVKRDGIVPGGLQGRVS